MSNQTTHIDPETTIKALREKITRLEKALAQPQQEPVAWMCHPYGDDEVEYGPHNQCENCMPLYTSPPARKPLTDEEIETVWRSVQANDFHDCVKPFARAVEAAHGIEENT